MSLASVIGSVETRGPVCVPAHTGAGRAQTVTLVSGPVPCFGGLASETDPVPSDTSPALVESETQGVVSLAHTLLFGCLWQQDPNNLDMCLYKKKNTGNGTQSGSLGPFS